MPRRRPDPRKPAPITRLDLDGERITYRLKTGGQFVGTLAEVNALLTATGHHEIAVRRNLMSGVLFIEAADTPYYCSPSSETYWSM